MQAEPQFPNSVCKILKPSCLVVKFPKLLPKPQVVFLCHHIKIWYPFIEQILWQKFSNLCRSSQFQKCMWQYLPFLNPLRSNYLGLQFQRIKCCSCWLTLLIYTSSFRVSKPMNKSQEVRCITQEHYSQHLSPTLMGLICHVGPWVSTRQFLSMTLKVSRPTVANFNLFRYLLIHTKNYRVKFVR